MKKYDTCIQPVYRQDPACEKFHGRDISAAADGTWYLGGHTRFLLTVDLIFENSVWDFGKSRFDIGFPNIYSPPIPTALTGVSAHNKEGNHE